MASWLLLGGLALMTQPTATSSAADVVTLRDGKVALGQVVDSNTGGKIVLVIRRAWAEADLPDWAARWQKAEEAWAPKALRQRKERLESWRRERGADRNSDGRLGAWLDQEIARLADDPKAARAPLMAVRLGRGEGKITAKRTPEAGRMLRQGWRAGFDDVETKSVEDLSRALEGRGFAMSTVDPAPIDSFLSIMPETEAAWQVRRAATEVIHEPGLRFVRHQGLILPEMRPGEAPDLSPALASLRNLLLDQPAGDPLESRLREVQARGRTGLVLTRLEIAVDFSRVIVESTLWVRRAPDRWEPAVSRSGVGRPDSLGAAAGQELIADPQIQAVFRTIESLGFGPVPPAMKQRSLQVGATTQRALGLARAALDQDLKSLALPIGDLP